MTVSSDNKGALTYVRDFETDPGRAGRQVCSGRIQYLLWPASERNHKQLIFYHGHECGLNGAIINPNSEAMMRAYYSFNA